MNLHLHILNSLNGGIIYADNDHVIRYMDAAAEEHFKKSGGKDLIGRNLFDFHRPESAQKITEYHQQMLEGKLEEIMVRKMDKLNAFMKAVRDEEGTLLGYMECFKPVSHVAEPIKENLYQKSYMLYDDIQQYKALKDVDFYKKVIPIDASVLEIGCGTGRVAFELAQRGNKVVALDLSKDMLNILNEKIVNNLEWLKGSIKTVHKDMVQFDLNQKFDRIIFPLRVFQMLLTDKHRNTCLSNIKEHLNQDGQVIIDMFNPDLTHLENWEKKRTLEMTFYSDKLAATVKREHIGIRHFDKQQIISYTNVYHLIKDGLEPQVFEEPMRMAYLMPEQAETLFKEQKFEVINLFGDWDMSQVDCKNKKQLIYTLKATS